MRSVTVGWTDLQATRVGLGTWAMGGDWLFGWGEQDDQRSIETIHKALDLGVNWLDTAPIYGLGHSEEIVGRALEGVQNPPLVATKCSRRWDHDGNPYGSMDRDSILAEAHASLKRLRLEVIDLYQIHWPIPDEGIEEAWRAIEELIASGLVRYGGVSNFDVTQMKRAQGIHRIATLQPPYSMLKRDVEKDVLPYCSEHEIGVIAYSPMQKGLLTGKVTRQWVESLPDGDHRKRDSDFSDPKLAVNLELVRRLEQIADRQGRSLAELAIAWTLAHPAVTAAIVGARTPSQIEATAPAGDWDLPEQVMDEIESALSEHTHGLAGAMAEA